MITVVIGKGQLAQCLAQVWERPIILLGHDIIDIATGCGFEILTQLCPDTIINTAAMHRIEECEDNPNLAMAVNYDGVCYLCDKAEELGSKFIHIGTDYMYAADSPRAPFTETEVADPVNVYGASKAAGVEAALERGHYVASVAGLWSNYPTRAKGSNFVLTMAEKARKHEKVFVVTNIISSFTYGIHAAKTIQFLLNKPAGLYNVVNSGYASWFEFAGEIFELAADWRAGVLPTTNCDDVPPRPRFSALSNDKLKSLGLVMPTWKEALQEYFGLRPKWEVEQ